MCNWRRPHGSARAGRTPTATTPKTASSRWPGGGRGCLPRRRLHRQVPPRHHPVDRLAMTIRKKTIRDIDVAGKRVLVRVDYNVPLDAETGRILDDSRIKATLATLGY